MNTKAATDKGAAELALTVNGKEFRVDEKQLEMNLLTFLRERLFLKGVKNGCEKGLCGSCTVVVDDKAVRACRSTVGKHLGQSIITIEGMEAPDGTLHPIQQAFMDAGAIQCGFCTPGMVMNAYALLLKDLSPTREAIRSAMRGNLCRCTGYQQIVDAIEAAAAHMRKSGGIVKAGRSDRSV